MYIGIMENKMESTIMGYIGYTLALYWSLYPRPNSEKTSKFRAEGFGFFLQVQKLRRESESQFYRDDSM